MFGGLTCFGLLVGTLLLIIGSSTSESRGQMLLAGVAIADGIMAGLWIRECGRLKVARLITENPILYIRTVIISDISGAQVQPEDAEDAEVFISYFGILLAGKIIKFNQDGIRLRAVEIGEDFISFTYGTDKWMRSIRQLRPAIDAVAMEEISERFSFETVITPTLLS